MGYSSFVVANTLLELAETRSIKDMTPMKIQKLLYYSQAWGLYVCKTSLIDEYFLRWESGPILASLYHELIDNGPNHVTKKLGLEYIDYEIEWKVINGNDDVSFALLNKILEQYGKIDPRHLAGITMAENSAWKLKGPDGSPILHKEMIEEIRSDKKDK